MFYIIWAVLSTLLLQLTSAHQKIFSVKNCILFLVYTANGVYVFTKKNFWNWNFCTDVTDIVMVLYIKSFVFSLFLIAYIQLVAAKITNEHDILTLIIFEIRVDDFYVTHILRQKNMVKPSDKCLSQTMIFTLHKFYVVSKNNDTNHSKQAITFSVHWISRKHLIILV